MDTLEPIFATIDAHLRARSSHAFLVTGNIGDDFPSMDRRTFRSFETALAERYPHRIFLRLDLVRGLTARTEEDAEKLQEALEPKAAKGKKKDPIEEARAAAERPEEGDVIAETVGAAMQVLRKLVRLQADAPDKEREKLLVWVPRLEAICPVGCANDAGIRAVVDALLGLFRDEAASDGGHLLVFGSRTAAALESALLGDDSRLVQMRVAKPDEGQRLDAVRRLTLDEEERRRLDACAVRSAQARRDVFARARALFDGHKSTMQDARKREEEIERRIQAEFDAENAQRAETIRRLERRLEHAAGQTEEADREGVRLYEEWLSSGATQKVEDRIVEPIGRRNWNELIPGDRVYQRHKGEISWFVVLEKRDKDVIFSFPIERKRPGVEIRAARNTKGELTPWHWDAKMDDAVSPPSGRLHNRDAQGRSQLNACLIRLPGTHAVVIRGRIEAERTAEAAALDKRRKRVEQEVAAVRSAIDGARKRFRKELRADPAIAGFREEAKRAAFEREEILKDRFPPPEMPISDLARVTSGLGYRDLRDLFALAQADREPLTRARVSRLKLKRLNDAYGHLVEVVEPSYGLEGIGGLDYVKDEMRRIVAAIRRGNARAVPMGVMLMGPPGTGKTAIAEALARETGFSFVKLKNVRSMWVGQSERQIEEILGALKDLAPCIVLRDEVDQEDSGRDAYQGDSGVSARIRQRWMEFLSDPKIRGQVLVISCTNRPDLIDAALKRSGRSDRRIPILMPDKETLERIFEVMMGPRYRIPHGIGSFREFAERVVGYSGADIERICLDAYVFADADGRSEVTGADIDAAIEDFIPAADQFEILRMTILALRQASSRRLMPTHILLPDLEGKLKEMMDAQGGGSKPPSDAN